MDCPMIGYGTGFGVGYLEGSGIGSPYGGLGVDKSYDYGDASGGGTKYGTNNPSSDGSGSGDWDGSGFGYGADNDVVYRSGGSSNGSGFGRGLIERSSHY